MVLIRWIVCFLLTGWVFCQSPTGKTMVITIDDLPFTWPRLKRAAKEIDWLNQRTDAMLKALQTYQVPAIGFVNESKLHVKGEIDQRLALLEKWLNAGMDLGNHTYGHPSLSRTSLEVYQDEVIRGEVLTRWLLKQYDKEMVYFRYPFNHRGPTAEIRDNFENFLTRRGYRVAPFTIEHADYLFNVAYVRAANSGDEEKKAKIYQAYLDFLEVKIDFFEALAQELFQRAIPQILLIHTNEINADALGDMLEVMKKRGYTFVGLNEALKDPAYKTKDSFVGTFGPSWLHRFSLSLGVAPVIRNGRSFPASLLREPEPPAFIIEASK